MLNSRINTFILVYGVFPSLLITIFVLLEPHLIRIVGVFLACYLTTFVCVLVIVIKLFSNDKQIGNLVNLGISFCSILTLLIIIELAFYFQYRDSSIGPGDSPSGVTFYPRYYKLNEFGFRDREFDLKPLTGTKRLLFLGDSFTFGMGIKNGNDAFPKVFERLLNNHGRDYNFEIINAGKKGYNTSQNLGLLRTIGLALNPDLVMLGYYLNDTDPKGAIGTAFGGAPKFLEKIDKKLSQHFFSWYLFRTRFLPDLNEITQNFNSMITSDKNFKIHEEVFSELVYLLKEKEIQIIVVIIPSNCYPVQGDVKMVEKQLSHIRMLCNKYNILSIDLEPVMEDLAYKYDCYDLVASKYDSHPSALVNQAYGEAIFNEFIANDMVKLMQTHQ